MVGCQRAKVAIVVDPGRDIDQYLEAAKREGVELIAVADTHIHADYVSGARELAERGNAKLYVSDEGPADWKFEYASQYDHELLHDGDSFMIGNIKFDVLHTPGHTPESISYLVTDVGGGADKPMGIFTGDFVFVGSIGRPDLLEEAAGLMGTAEPGARELFHSAQRFKQLPDYLQVWPAHGAGSACGKGLGAIPSSTVGYEKRFNPALQIANEDSFVRYILAEQPEAPKYFAVMKHVNKVGPAVLGLNQATVSLEAKQVDAAIDEGTVIDLRPSTAFADGHVAGTLNIPLGMLAAWAGWIVDYDKPVYLISDSDQQTEAIRILHKIGIDRILGVFNAKQIAESGLANETYQSASPDFLQPMIESGEIALIDVRSNAEWAEGHIDAAQHRFLGKLPTQLEHLPTDKPIVTQCRSGARSAIAASVIQAAGFTPINMTGGYAAWHQAELPTVKDRRTESVVHSA